MGYCGCGCDIYKETDLAWMLNFIKEFKAGQENDFQLALKEYMDKYFSSYQIGAIYNAKERRIYLAQATDDKEQLAQLAQDIQAVRELAEMQGIDIETLQSDVNDIKSDIEFKTWSGIINQGGASCRLIKFGKALQISFSGSVTNQIDVLSKYADIIDITPSGIELPPSGILKNVINGAYYFQLNSSGNIIRFGYCRNMSNNENAVINAGTTLYIKETFVQN